MNPLTDVAPAHYETSVITINTKQKKVFCMSFLKVNRVPQFSFCKFLNGTTSIAKRERQLKTCRIVRSNNSSANGYPPSSFP